MILYFFSLVGNDDGDGVDYGDGVDVVIRSVCRMRWGRLDLRSFEGLSDVINEILTIKLISSTLYLSLFITRLR